MDALVALAAPGTEGSLSAAVASMLEQLWPREQRSDAVVAAAGVAIGSARTRLAAQALGAPVVHQAAGDFLARRWDWPTLPGSLPGDAAVQRPGPAADPASPQALIAWDAGRRALTIQRDPFGEASFWYAHEGDRFAVASHPQPLFALDWVNAEPDPVGVPTAWIAMRPGDHSPWRMIRRLQAGHRLSYRDGQVQVERWWQLARMPADPTLRDAEWFVRVRDALERSVARRIPARGIVGAQLSGGLDSAAVSLIASRHLSVHGRPLHTFSHFPAVRWNPPRPGDETPYVEAALGRMPNAVPHACTGQETEGTKFERRTLLPHDRSVRDAAREAGVGCLLSGWGGDEGISYNGDGFLAGQLLRLNVLPVLRWCWSFGGGTGHGLVSVLLHKVLYQQLGFLRPTAVHPDPSRRFRRERIQELTGEARSQARQGYRASRRLRSAASAHENQRRLLSSPHIANRIDFDTEWSLPAGFCFRYPLLDPEVIQVALQVPERLLVLNGRTRTLIREAMRGLYPDLIQDRHGKFASHPPVPRFRTLD